MCPLVLAMKPDQGIPRGLSHTSGLSGKTCCLGESRLALFGKQGLQQGCFGDSYGRLEVSFPQPFHLESWVYKEELIDELIISTDTSLAAAGAIQGPSIRAMQ